MGPRMHHEGEDKGRSYGGGLWAAGITLPILGVLLLGATVLLAAVWAGGLNDVDAAASHRAIIGQLTHLAWGLIGVGALLLAAKACCSWYACCDWDEEDEHPHTHPE